VTTGTVKWFHRKKGYGFIIPDGEKKDLFVHFSDILMDGYKALYEGDVVEFEVGEGPNGGSVAKNVRVLTSAREAHKTQEAIDVIRRCVDAVPKKPLPTSLEDFPGSVVVPLP